MRRHAQTRSQNLSSRFSADPRPALLAAGLSLLAALAAGCVDAPMLLDEEGHVAAREAAIVNGSVDPGHPAVGALHSGNKAACTATLIGSRTVLTAAHCVMDKSHNLYSPVNFYIGGLYSGTKYVASSVHPHPSYAGGNQSDIAVVRLSKTVTGVSPMPIASAAPFKGESVVLVGYGLPGENQGKYGTKRKASNVIAKVSSQIFSMNGASGAQGNLCDGDSGGPTFAMRGGQEVQIGVHSTKGGACGVQGNDMRVDVFRSWIIQKAGGDVVGTGPSDQQAPQVKILKPAANNAVVTPSFTLQVSANDDVGVTRVAVFINGSKASEKVQAPFGFNMQNVPSGTHTIEAVAYDKVGHSSSDARTISVQTGGSTGPGTKRPWLASCDSGSQCQSGVCAADSTGTFCSRTCGQTSDCPGNFVCQQGICRHGSAGTHPGTPPGTHPGPAPGSFGATCSTHADCTSGLCARDNVTGQNFCTALCDVTQNNCPGGATCHPTGDKAVCGPMHHPMTGDGTMLNGGCSVGSAPASAGAPLLTLLGLLALMAWRRRR